MSDGLLQSLWQSRSPGEAPVHRFHVGVFTVLALLVILFTDGNTFAWILIAAVTLGKMAGDLLRSRLANRKQPATSA